MEKFLFRGQPLHAHSVRVSGFVYGYLVHTKKTSRIYITDENGDIDEDQYISIPCPIYPASAGICTGKTDINGVKIFSGDFVKAKSYNYQHLNEYIYEIYYCPEQMCFKMRNNIAFPHNFDDDIVGFHSFEVVGNIVYNPELKK